MIIYDNQEYYVLKYSSVLNENVTLLKKELLTKEEINEYSDNYVSQNGEYPYLENDTCYRAYDDMENEWYMVNNGGCTNDYNDSDIKKIIDKWANKYDSDLVIKNNYKARIIDYSEIFDCMAFEEYDISPSQIGYKKSDDTPEWTVINDRPYWTMFKYEDSNTNVYQISII